jgi:hypothetical protein
MRFALVLLVACSQSAASPAFPPDDVEEIRSISISPARHQDVEIDYVSGGGAAGYTGLRLTLLRPGHEPTELGLVGDSTHPTVIWHDEKLELAGCFRDWDLGNLRDGARRGGLDVAIQIRC